jgi:hypothetical protein
MKQALNIIVATILYSLAGIGFIGLCAIAANLFATQT